MKEIVDMVVEVEGKYDETEGDHIWHEEEGDAGLGTATGCGHHRVVGGVERLTVNLHEGEDGE